MTYKEAMEKSLTVPWKTDVCSQGEQCWCRMIVPAIPIIDDEGDEIYIASSGEVNKFYAEHIVQIHNNSLLK